MNTNKYIFFESIFSRLKNTGDFANVVDGLARIREETREGVEGLLNHSD